MVKVCQEQLAANQSGQTPNRPSIQSDRGIFECRGRLPNYAGKTGNTPHLVSTSQGTFCFLGTGFRATPLVNYTWSTFRQTNDEAGYEKCKCNHLCERLTRNECETRVEDPLPARAKLIIRVRHHPCYRRSGQRVRQPEKPKQDELGCKHQDTKMAEDGVSAPGLDDISRPKPSKRLSNKT